MKSDLSVPKLFLVLGLCAASVAGAGRKPIPRGYLDKAYRLDNLNGRDIHFHGLSKANAKLERTLVTAEGHEEPMVMEPLYREFNARMAFTLRKFLGKSQVIGMDSVAGRRAISINKLIGDSALPDSLTLRFPEPPRVGTPGREPGISLVVGKVVFGVRSQMVERYRYPAPLHDPNRHGFPPKFNPPMPRLPKFKQRYFAEPPEDPLENQEERLSNPYVVREGKKRFYTLVEFCFYDHRTARAFGYGWDGEETEFRGDLAQALFGKKLDMESHMRSQADRLAEILVRKGRRLDHYRDTEIVLAAEAPPPAERIREELEVEDEE